MNIGIKQRLSCSNVASWLLLLLLNVFTALHVMQTRYSDEISVRPSVCQVQLTLIGSPLRAFQ